MNHPTDTERSQIAGAMLGDASADQTKYAAYFSYYCAVVCPPSEAATVTIDTPTLDTHAKVLLCFAKLKTNPDLTFTEFITHLGANTQQEREKGHIANVTSQTGLCLDCFISSNSTVIFPRDRSTSVQWGETEKFVDVLSQAFTQLKRGQPPTAQDVAKYKKTLKAWKLRKRYNIKIRPTDNLLEHLSFNSTTMVLRVFHQVAWLQAQLRKTRNDVLDLGFSDSLKKGTLPPRLLLETLSSIHDVLFPLAATGEKRTHALMNKMIRKYDFDAEATWVASERPFPEEFVYSYWGDRLKTLYDFAKKPPPGNAFVAWYDRHTTERNALTVAIIGLFLAVLFGILGFIVSVIQLVIAWLAWKHPVAP